MRKRSGGKGPGVSLRETARGLGQAAVPPAPAPKKIKADFRLIGRRTPRVDGSLIVTGAAPYTHDLELDRMLVGRVLRSPHPAAEVVSVDLAPALALRGVKAGIVTARGRVKYAGDPVAAVAAIDDLTAEEALKLIKVEYKVLPYVVSEDKAREPGAPQVLDKPNIQKLDDRNRGDTGRGLAEADVVLERTYRTSWEVHQPAETHSSLAAWSGDTLTVWDSTQAIHSVRDQLARALNMPAAKVRVIKQYMGGGFGSKLELNDFTVFAALLARQAGRPVRIILTRRENSTCVGYRPSCVMTVKAGAKKDGTLTALRFTNYSCGGVGEGDGSGEPAFDLYRCPNVKLEEYSVAANLCEGRATRAPGHTQGTLALEGLMEELADTLGLDPLAFRMKNYTLRNEGGGGLPYSIKNLDECYRLGAEKIGWNRRKAGPGRGNGRLRRGLGMASQIWWGGGLPGTMADIIIHPDGSVEAVSGTQDIGCGTRTHMALVAADTLGLEPEDITVKLGDTDLPWAPLSGGSLTSPSVAPAVRDAALKAAAALKSVAAKTLGLTAADIVLGGRKLTSAADPERFMSFADAAKALRRETAFHGERSGMPQDAAFNTFGAQFAEVEVDTETGKVRVLKVVAVHDVGRVLNLSTAESQVIGGITQGLSAALFERKLMDDNTGRMVNPNFHDYKIATAADIPEIIPLFIDAPDDKCNNLGVKGLGEPPRIPASAVIANAVYNAIGVHVGEIPMTPDRVLRALKAQEGRR
jgi:xanthine dehydrogenase YagR molybdenum-binding subunit